MNIIICGAGRVGYTIAKLLSEQNHSITVIDQSSEDIQKINDDKDNSSNKNKLQKLKEEAQSDRIARENEISSTDQKKPIEKFVADNKEKKSYLDISHKDSGKEKGAITVPNWSLELQPKYRTNKTYNVQFNILDIAGVCFSIKLPTAEARLEGIEPDF